MMIIGSETSSGDSTRYTLNFTPEWFRSAALLAPGKYSGAAVSLLRLPVALLIAFIGLAMLTTRDFALFEASNCPPAPAALTLALAGKASSSSSFPSDKRSGGRGRVFDVARVRRVSTYSRPRRPMITTRGGADATRARNGVKSRVTIGRSQAVGRRGLAVGRPAPRRRRPHRTAALSRRTMVALALTQITVARRSALSRDVRGKFRVGSGAPTTRARAASRRVDASSRDARIASRGIRGGYDASE